MSETRKETRIRVEIGNKTLWPKIRAKNVAIECVLVSSLVNKIATIKTIIRAFNLTLVGLVGPSIQLFEFELVFSLTL